jgi:hypothetical protein
MRRAGALLILLAAALPDAAEAQDEAGPPGDPASAEAVMRAYHARIAEALGIACRRGPGDEIVVCGRSVETGRQTLPLGSQPEPGERTRLVAGEPPSAMAALGAGQCISRCQSMVGVDVIGTVNAIGRGIGRLLHPD